MRNLLLCAVIALASTCALSAETKLLLFGGGNYPAEGLSKFCEWSGGNSGTILLIHWASDLTDTIPPNQAVIRDNFQHCIGTLETAPSYLELGAQKTIFLAQLKRAQGVFFTGGDQNQIMNLLAQHTELIQVLHERYNEGVAFGGTSAGTAIMSVTMLTGNGDFTTIDSKAVETRPGLGLLTAAVVDQHFVKRMRLNRLLSVLQQQKDKLGIGIDEDGAATVRNGRYLQVLAGISLAVQYDKSPSDLQLNILSPTDKFDLVEKHRIP